MVEHHVDIVGVGGSIPLAPTNHATRRFVQLAEILTGTARETVQTTPNGLELEIKADGSPVTTLDRAVEAALRHVIERRQPGHGII